MTRPALLASFFLLLAGCVSLEGGAPFSESAHPPVQGRALVFVFRAPDGFAAGRTPTVRVRDQRPLELHNLGYAALTVLPGSYRVSAEWPRDVGMQVGSDFVFDADRTYYVQVAARATSMTGIVTPTPVFVFKGEATMRLVERDAALKILQACTSVF